MFKSLIYDAVMRPVTRRWYREVLKRLPEGAGLLDIGIGTGGALSSNAELVQRKHLKITGIDIDQDYVERARVRIKKKHLARNVEIRLESIYDHQGGPYNAIYFSGSFMLLPEPERALRHAALLLAPHGRIYFTQTFFDKRSPVLEKAKPLLGKITTIEFGRVTYARDFLQMLMNAGLRLEEFVTMKSMGDHSYRLAIAVPEANTE